MPRMRRIGLKCFPSVIARVVLVCLAVFIVGRRSRRMRKIPRSNAATADALESLKREVVTVHITPDLTVQDLLDRVGGTENLPQMLAGV